MTSVCFVCLGNICRSPTAAAVFRDLARGAGLLDKFRIESAGTGGAFLGSPPDERAVAAASRRGVLLSGQSRQFQPDDFDRYDLVVALDRRNRADLWALAGNDPNRRRKVVLLRQFAPDGGEQDVPDPFLGSDADFEVVLDQCEQACAGLLASLRKPLDPVEGARP